MGLRSISKVYDAIGDQGSEIQPLYKVLDIQGPFVEGAHSLAAIRLANIFLEKQLLDSAELYYARAEYLGSPFADGVLDDIDKLRDKLGLQHEDKMAILSRYTQFEPSPALEAIDGKIKTLSGAVEYSSSNPFFCSFPRLTVQCARNTCPVCIRH